MSEKSTPDAKIVFRLLDGSELTEDKIISFNFVKEFYTPYTSFSARYIAQNLSPENFSEILFYIDDKLVHHGLVDSITVNRGDISTGTLYSKGFTSMLKQNQTEPGLYTGTTINSLMDSFYKIPYVTHEENSTEGYIYVKKGSSMWDALVSLSYKLTGTYPYIRSTNCVMITPVAEPVLFNYSGDGIISTGQSITEKRLISDFHMSDINEEYGTYELNDKDVSDRNIVRHKFFELDRRFLQNPEQALDFYDSFTARGWRRNFVKYCGYRGEDISDIASFGEISEGRISGVNIEGGRDGIFTEISVYRDKFFP